MIEKYLGTFPDSAAVNASDELGNTVLHLACMTTPSVVTLLLRSSINVNAQNRSGDTALHLAATSGSSTAVTALLSENGIDSNLKDSSGRTADCVTTDIRIATAIIEHRNRSIGPGDAAMSRPNSIPLPQSIPEVSANVTRNKDGSKHFYAASTAPNPVSAPPQVAPQQPAKSLGSFEERLRAIDCDDFGDWEDPISFKIIQQPILIDRQWYDKNELLKVFKKDQNEIPNPFNRAPIKKAVVMNMKVSESALQEIEAYVLKKEQEAAAKDNRSGPSFFPNVKPAAKAQDSKRTQRSPGRP